MSQKRSVQPTVVKSNDGRSYQDANVAMHGISELARQIAHQLGCQELDPALAERIVNLIGDYVSSAQCFSYADDQPRTELMACLAQAQVAVNRYKAGFLIDRMALLRIEDEGSAH